MFARIVMTLAVLGAVTPRECLAQTAATRVRGGFETRAELQAELNQATAGNQTSEVILIRNRLDHGDFQDGDRIIVAIRGPAPVLDTITLRSGKRLELPQMGDLSLEGTLRSELVPQLTTQVAKYLRDPVVQATPLIRVGILGSVVRPGFYYTPADVPLSDVLMAAGGPTTDANLSKVTVTRDRSVIVNEANTRSALTNGASIDMLHMRAGDEITVGKETQFNWAVLVSSASALIGVLYALTRH